MLECVYTTDNDLEVAIGYNQSGYGDDLYNKGSFEVDEVVVSGPPDSMMIIAKGSRINKSLKQPRTKTYNNITLGELVNAIAMRNGMQAKIGQSLAVIKIEQLNQKNETDLNLLTRLTTSYDGKVKAISGVILFYPKDSFRKTSGAALEKIIINKSDCSKHSFSKNGKSRFDAVIAKWRDNDIGKTINVQVGTGKKIYSLKPIFASEEEARNKAQTKYNNLLRGKVNGSLTTIGNPKIASEFEIQLAGFREQLITTYKCESCTHTLSGLHGYKTMLKVVNKK